MRKTLAHDSTSETDIHRSANAQIRKTTSVHFGSIRFSRSECTLILFDHGAPRTRCHQKFFDPPPAHGPYFSSHQSSQNGFTSLYRPTPPLPMLDRIAVFADVRTGLLAKIEKVLRRNMAVRAQGLQLAR